MPQSDLFARIEAFVRDVRLVRSEAELADELGSVAVDLGFYYFALTHHVDVRDFSTAVRLHNYPAGWESWFDEQRLGATDPVHRASHVTSVGFAWSDLSTLIHLTNDDRRILGLARREGIGDGFTVPAYVPGEAHGSCSFATKAGTALPADRLALAHLAGAFAFEAARRMSSARVIPLVRRLTHRQRECVVWAAQGKSDWEISQIMGVSQETVIQHLKQARERYGVGKRTPLAIHALFDGTIAFLDVLRP